MNTGTSRNTRVYASRTAIFGSFALLTLAATSCGPKEAAPATDTAAAAPASAPATATEAKEEFTVSMKGADERPNPVTTPATGTAELSFTGSGEIAYSINVTGLSATPTAAHIHGPADANSAADPIITFAPVGKEMTGPLLSGSITTTGIPNVSMDSLKTLLRNGHAYLNVHTTTHPKGEIRGMITKK